MKADYPVAYGALEGAVIGIAIELQHTIGPIDGKAMAERLREAISRAEQRGGVPSVDDLIAAHKEITDGN